MAHPKLQTVKERYAFCCGYCGVSEADVGGELTVDHFRPISAGGDHSDENLVYACVLKSIIEAVDRFGLKAHYLRKYKTFVWRFYQDIFKRDYKSAIAAYYKKRLEKNQDKIFTFLDYDGIPWNNNNAEHAIKAFASLRKVIGGLSTEKGIREYLTLLSICETCKYKGVSFLEFLRSGEKDIDVFIKKGPRVSKGVGFESLLPE